MRDDRNQRLHVLTELNRGDDRDTLAFYWGRGPGLVDRAWEALDA